jgi:hypothetical protein
VENIVAKVLEVLSQAPELAPYVVSCLGLVVGGMALYVALVALRKR